MTNDEIILHAKKTIQLEADSLLQLITYVNPTFVEAIQLISSSKGRLVISGIGKSALIAQKIVATLNSTGTAALFMHAADAIHGDLGMMQENDLAMLISKSGESEEIKVLVPLLKNFKHPIIALCGNEHSYLATHADYFINCTVSKEACPNNLAPTSSTTAQLAMGDALAMCLLQLKGFSATDFAKFHPGGALGKRMYLKVADLLAKNEMPKVFANTILKDIINEISSKRMGATAVVDNENKLLGIITDGDVRRMLADKDDLKNIIASAIMTTTSKTISPNVLAVEGLNLMQENNISQLIVVENNDYKGMIHLHDLLKEGLL